MFPIQTPDQLTAYLRALRKTRGLTQAQLGAMLGVSTARVSEIEKDPASVSSAQIHHIVQLLGARLVVETRDPSAPSPGTARPVGGEW